MSVHKKKLTDYMQKFKPDGLVSDHSGTIKVFVPQRYEIHDLYLIGEYTSVLGLFQIEVEGEPHLYNLVLPAMVDMQPSTILPWHSTQDEVDYYVLTFRKGDVFIKSLTVLKQGFILSKLFKEFVTNGHMPPWMSYDQMASVFDVTQVVTGKTLPVPHSCFELMVAHCCRDPKSPNIKYRFTSMREKPLFLGLRDVTNVRDSVTSRIVGSYFMDGVNASIVNKSEHRSEVEDLLRT